MRMFLLVCVLLSALCPARAQGPSSPASPGLIGLVDIPFLYEQAGGKEGHVRIDIREQPLPSARVVSFADPSGIRSAPSNLLLCRWRRDLDVSHSPIGCIFAESGYEIPAIAVFEKVNDWLRIALSDRGDRFGWLRADDAQYHPLDSLIASSERLTYLTAAWDGRLYREPGVSPAMVLPAEKRRNTNTDSGADVPYKPLAHRYVQGRLWLKVQILNHSPCGEGEPRVLHVGWLPAQAVTGEAWAWFYSRGC